MTKYPISGELPVRVKCRVVWQHHLPVSGGNAFFHFVELCFFSLDMLVQMSAFRHAEFHIILLFISYHSSRSDYNIYLFEFGGVLVTADL